VGYGQDVRTRKSWDVYYAAGTRLVASAIDTAGMLRGEQPPLPRGAFLIGNHADELTPWVPVLACCVPACTGFVNIPCCAWTLEGVRFTPTQRTLAPDDITKRFLVGVADVPPVAMPQAPLTHASPSFATRAANTHWFLRRVIIPPDGGATHSKHYAYYAYIAELHIRAGWCLETEALRIPSTKNWAFVARCRACDGVKDAPSDWPERIDAQFQYLAASAVFMKTRLPNDTRHE